MKYLPLLFLFLLPSFSYASWINGTKIVDVRWYSDFGYITTENNENPECPSAPLTQYKRLDVSNIGHEKIISMALAAMMADKEININLNGCYDDKYSEVTGIVVKK